MIKGGKGLKISEEDTVDTMPQLAAMIGCSHDTLRKVQYILNTMHQGIKKRGSLPFFIGIKVLRILEG